MVRDITANATTASEAASGYSMVLACELEFETRIERLHTGIGPVLFPDGRTFDGVGDFASLSVIRETTETRAQQLDLTLSGLEVVPSLNLSSILTEDLRERPVTGYLVFIDSLGVVVDDPIVLNKSLMSHFTVLHGSSVAITLRVEDLLSLWERSSRIRYTHEAQQTMFPEDKGLEFVPQQVEKELFWGRT